MDWLTFITKIVEALAWPLVVLYVLIKFKEKIIALIPKLNKLEAGPLKAEFREEAAKVLKEADVRVHDAIKDENLRRLSADLNVFTIEHFIRPLKQAEEVSKSFAYTQPAAAVLLAWDNIEVAMLDRISEHGVYVPEKQTAEPTAWMRALLKEKQISEDVYRLIDELNTLRNKVTHGEDPTPESAWDFVQATERVVPLIKYQKP